MTFFSFYFNNKAVIFLKKRFTQEHTNKTYKVIEDDNDVLLLDLFNHPIFNSHL